MDGPALQSVDGAPATSSDVSSCTADESEAFMRSYGHEEQMKASQGHPTLEDFLGSKSKAHHVFDHSRLMNARVLYGVDEASFSLSSLKNSVLSVYKDYKTPNDGIQGSNQNFAGDIGIPRRALTGSIKGVDIETEGMHRQFHANGRAFASPTSLTLTQPSTAGWSMDSGNCAFPYCKRRDCSVNELQSIIQYSATTSPAVTVQQSNPSFGLEGYSLSRAASLIPNFTSNNIAAYMQDMGSLRGGYLNSSDREREGNANGSCNINIGAETAFGNNGISRVNAVNGCLQGLLNNPNFNKQEGPSISPNDAQGQPFSPTHLPFNQQSALSLSRDTASSHPLRNTNTMPSPRCNDQFSSDYISSQQAEALKLSIRNCSSLFDSAGVKRDLLWPANEQNCKREGFTPCAGTARKSTERTVYLRDASGEEDPFNSKASRAIAAGLIETSVPSSDDHLQLQLVHSSAGQQMVQHTNSGVSLDAGNGESTSRKSIETFGQRTSVYRGVTKHRWTGRFEAHLWDNSCRREGQSRKGRQVYLGGYDLEEKAARAYDLAALKYWGPTTTINFPLENYEKELEDMKSMTKQEFVASLRRKSSGFSRGASIYRGVTRHHQHGRWQARIGRVAGNKDLYLGTFSTQEEAAEAYDIAAIKFRGLNAVTNFDMNKYDIEKICSNNLLPIQTMRRVKENISAAADLMQADDVKGGFQRESAYFPYGSGSFDHIASRAGSIQEWQFINQLSQPYPPYNHDSSSLMWSKTDQERAKYALHTGLLFHQSNNSKLLEGTYSSLMHGTSSFPHVESSAHSMQSQRAPDLESTSAILATQVPGRYAFGGHLFTSQAADNSNVCEQVQGAQAPECVSLQL